MSDKPGRYMDAGTIMRELGLKRTAADAIMRQLPKYRVPGVKKHYVLRADVERFEREQMRAA